MRAARSLMTDGELKDEVEGETAAQRSTDDNTEVEARMGKMEERMAAVFSRMEAISTNVEELVKGVDSGPRPVHRRLSRNIFSSKDLGPSSTAPNTP
mmetsp:Transcript_54341/g.128197  ORF Transcript_54341/g.128197 Transcript_54341/m.128197 type:complete len:97 (+) Transcript_54341:3-293(+)